MRWVPPRLAQLAPRSRRNQNAMLPQDFWTCLTPHRVMIEVQTTGIRHSVTTTQADYISIPAATLVVAKTPAYASRDLVRL